MIERLEVVAGSGTVIRYGAVVAWAAPSASPALISFLAQSARNLSGSARGGRQMADHIASVLHERDPEPQVAFAVVGPDALGWASLLHGPVQAWDGQRWLAPSPSPGWLQAIITPQPSVMVNAAGSPVPVVSPDSMWDLEAGVVPGSGFVLFPSKAKIAEAGSTGDPIAAPEADPGSSGLGSSGPGSSGLAATGPGASAPGAADPVSSPEPLAAPQVGAAAGARGAFGSQPFESEETAVLEASPPTEIIQAAEPEKASAGERGSAPETLVLAESEQPQREQGELERARREQAEPARPPGPPGSIDLRRPSTLELRPPLASGAGPDRSIPGAPVVGGLLCEREHLNRPGMRTCVRCGAPVRTGATYTISGSRPPLGCLVGDDGTIWRLDSPYLVGTNPANDPTVRGGIARPLSLEGADMAAAHAEFRLTGWDVEVVDRSSPGGTFVFEPGAGEWMRLKPYEPTILRPGTHVAFGQRVVTFLTPWVLPAENAQNGP